MSGKVIAYYGAVINPEDIKSYSIWPRALVAVDASGTIVWIEKDVHPAGVPNLLKDGMELVELNNSEFLLPGFIDTHTHAPQVPNTGSGQQYELLAWLENVTFPMEERFGDLDFAGKVYPHVVRRFIDHGTTTCCYYGSLHGSSTQVLADTIMQQGQRALVGKCNMNRNSPKTYCEASTAKSIEDTKHLISYIRSLPTTLIRPVLTPRFAISCTGDLLLALGHLAEKDKELHIQTHISENKGEIDFTKELFPNCKSYTDVYLQHGLLKDRTILAHGVHLEDDELDLIKQNGAGISHCPTSNFNLSSGMAKVGRMLDKGIKVGLGTDVSGGFSLSMLTAIQHASMCSKMVATHSSSLPTEEEGNDNGFAGKQLSIPTLLYLATMGGAELCCLQDKIGSFKSGKCFDALLVSTHPEHGNLSVWGTDEEFAQRNLKHVDQDKARKELDAGLERFLFCGDNRNIQKVFVQGKFIGGVQFKHRLPS